MKNIYVILERDCQKTYGSYLLRGMVTNRKAAEKEFKRLSPIFIKNNRADWSLVLAVHTLVQCINSHGNLLHDLKILEEVKGGC